VPTSQPVSVEIFYFYSQPTRTDVDNLIKPVLDALNQLVYLDDRQVMNILAVKRDIRHPHRFKSNRTSELEDKLSEQQAFLYVMIRTISDIKDLP
jgi:hypothetical protein